MEQNKYGKWVAEHTCVNCKNELPWHRRTQNHGVCPICYFDGRHAKLCATVRRVKRWVTTKEHPWWMVWKSNEGYWEYKAP